MSAKKFGTAFLLSLAGALLVPSAFASPATRDGRPDQHKPAPRHGHRPAPKPKPKPKPAPGQAG